MQLMIKDRQLFQIFFLAAKNVTHVSHTEGLVHVRTEVVVAPLLDDKHLEMMGPQQHGNVTQKTKETLKAHGDIF